MTTAEADRGKSLHMHSPPATSLSRLLNLLHPPFASITPADSYTWCNQPSRSACFLVDPPLSGRKIRRRMSSSKAVLEDRPLGGVVLTVAKTSQIAVGVKKTKALRKKSAMAMAWWSETGSTCLMWTAKVDSTLAVARCSKSVVMMSTLVSLLLTMLALISSGLALLQ